MDSYGDETRVIELLAPLRRLESVPFGDSRQPARRRLRRPVIAAAIVAAALALAGVAIAAGLGAFNGIAAAQHPQTAADIIDPATRAYMECSPPDGSSSTSVQPCMPVIHGLLFDTARVVGHLPSGQNIYVVTTTSNSLCYIVGPPHPEWNCEDPLSRSHPSTVFAYTQDGEPWTIVGVALDGVTSVSFDEDGQKVTLPVKDNVWTYQTDTAEAFYYAGSKLTVHFADGTTVVQTYP